MRRKSSLNSLLRWPIIGRVISARISGRTQVGPGTKYFARGKKTPYGEYDDPERFAVFRPHEIAWIFLLGWMAARSRTGLHRAAVSAVSLAAVPGFFGSPAW